MRYTSWHAPSHVVRIQRKYKEGALRNVMFEYHRNLKELVKHQLKKTRMELNLTQEQMAKRLDMDPSSYSNIETGKFSCSMYTFARYLIYCCPNRDEFLDSVREALESEENYTA